MNAPAASIICKREASPPDRGTIVMAERQKTASKLINAQASDMTKSFLMVRRYLYNCCFTF
jgi:hypothetical protein